ncbi:TetR/AcrR family transcriptional regulator [Streptomyces sp. NPDC001833]|uniref:TetR/AcrR family transcriptional regulator n=1 Tax=Streptomyces sp. NPDC001833 TaxID=3154658 RepID=UPI0033277CF1
MARVREFDTEAAVEAAMAAFCCTGYEGTSVQDLVNATNVGRGSLYAAFGSKEGLYRAAVDRYRERYADPLVDVLRSGAPARELLREVFVDLVDEIVRDGNHRACLIVSAATERIRYDAEVARSVRGTIGALEDALTDLIAEAQEQGQVRASKSARDLARFFVATMQGMRIVGAITPDRAALMASAEVALSSLD